METLIQKAKSYRNNAYAPFSNFFVGAAILTDDNTIIGGCNIESHSFGLTICAERSAIFSAIAQGHNHFQALAVAIKSNTTPCGACRQVIAEQCGNIPIYIYNIDTQQTQTVYAFDLLPNQFSLLTDQSLSKKFHHESL